MTLFRFQRFWLNVAVGLSIVTLPWWISVVLVLVLLFIVQAYEVLLWGIVFDVLYAAPVPSFFDLPLFFTALCIILFITVEYSKRLLVFY